MIVRFFQDLVRDVRQAFRSFRRNPGFSLIAVIILGLGLGANAAIFGLLDAALLRPLPYRDADRLVTAHILAKEGKAALPDLFPWSNPKLELFRKSQSSFADLAGYSTTSLNLITPDGPERLETEIVGAAYFHVLGVKPALGRLLVPGEDARPGEPQVVVLGHQLWEREFGGDSTVIGRQVRFDGRALSVVGVAPRGFRGLTGQADAFVPLSLAVDFEYSEILTEAGNHWLLAVGRLRPGVTLAQAREDAARAGAAVDKQYHMPEQSESWSAITRPLAESRADPGFRRSMLLLAGAVGLVLLIACVNLTSLLLVRAVARRREIAVRLALGAARARLVRQVLTESLVLSLGGFGVALLVAMLATPLLLKLGFGSGGGGNGESYFFDPATVSVNGTVIGAAFALSLLAALLVGLVPALQASRPAVTETLKGSGSTSRSGWSLRRGIGAHQLLVISEVALAIVLLVGAGLLGRSFGALHGQDPGFTPDHILTMRYAAAEGDFALRDASAFKAAVLDRVRGIPGVASASIGLCAPMASRCSVSVVSNVDGRKFAFGSGSVPIGLNPATPDHFRTMGIPVLRGRVFDAGDRRGAPRVVVINETAAKRLWPGQDPLGRQMAAASGFFAGGDSIATVVGVVKDVRYGAIESEMMPDLYYPAYQTGFGSFGTFFIRTSVDPLSVQAAVEREVHALDPRLPLFNVMTMEERAGAALARQRFGATLLGAFAALALALASIGLYGVMAFSVAQRTREIGLRMALGAGAPRVLGEVLGQGLAMAGVGIALGLLGALALQKLGAGMLYGVSPTDPVTLGGVALLMLAAALLAAALPARRATRVDPMVAIRAE